MASGLGIKRHQFKIWKFQEAQLISYANCGSIIPKRYNLFWGQTQIVLGYHTQLCLEKKFCEGMFFTVYDPASVCWLVFFLLLTHPIAQK